MNDPLVYKMIGDGKTEGLFQLESAGMKEFMRELKPESLEDIIAGIFILMEDKFKISSVVPFSTIFPPYMI